MVSASSQAAVVFTNLVGNRNYQTSSFSQFSPSYKYAVAFVPTASGTLDTLSVPLVINNGNNPNAPNTATLTLTLTLDNGDQPGTSLESFNLTNLVRYGESTSGRLETATSSLHPALVQGQKYWVVATPPNGTLGWFDSASGARGNYLYSPDNGQTWGFGSDALTGALEVTAAVPEPATVGMLAGGLLLALRRRVPRSFR